MTTRDISRLPNWAQDEINGRDMRIAQLEQELERERYDKNQKYPNSNIVLRNTTYPTTDTPLPPYSAITFYMNKNGEPREDYNNGIEIRHSLNYPQQLSVQGYSGAVLVKPSAANALSLILEKRF